MRIRALALLLCLSLAAWAGDGTDWFPWLGLRLDDHLTVVEVWPGSSADRAGIRRGDQLVAIGDVPAPPHAPGLKGALGSRVTLTLTRESKRYTVTLTHETLAQPTASVDPSLKPDDLDRALILVEGHDDRTDLYYNLLLQATARLPRDVKHRLVHAGVHLVLTPALTLVVPQKSGSSEYVHRLHYAIICEHGIDETPSPEVDPRIPIVTLHELGHAYDDISGYYSRTPEFVAAWKAEMPLTPGRDQVILEHFRKPLPMGPSECFASLFAARYYKNPDRRLDALKADFPRCFSLVQALP